MATNSGTSAGQGYGCIKIASIKHPEIFNENLKIKGFGRIGATSGENDTRRINYSISGNLYELTNSTIGYMYTGTANASGANEVITLKGIGSFENGDTYIFSKIDQGETYNAVKFKRSGYYIYWAGRMPSFMYVTAGCYANTPISYDGWTVWWYLGETLTYK